MLLQPLYPPDLALARWKEIWLQLWYHCSNISFEDLLIWERSKFWRNVGLDVWNSMKSSWEINRLLSKNLSFIQLVTNFFCYPREKMKNIVDIWLTFSMRILIENTWAQHNFFVGIVTKFRNSNSRNIYWKLKE